MAYEQAPLFPGEPIATKVVYPGEVMFNGLTGWVAAGLRPDEMIAKVESVAGPLNERDTRVLGAWAVEELQRYSEQQQLERLFELEGPGQ